MKGFFIVKNGKCISEMHSIESGNCARQIVNQNGLELVIYEMPTGVHGAFQPLEQEGETEVYYILAGRIRIFPLDGPEVELTVGDTFYFTENKAMLAFEIPEALKMILFRNESQFEQDAELYRVLTEVLVELQQADGDTFTHCDRVRTLSMQLARRMHYRPGGLRDLFFAARFHDVGKSKLPVELLIKPGRLTDEEYAVMKTHAALSAEMVRAEFGDEVARIVAEHHERPDGKGYPRGLTAGEIHPAAAIIAVADSYDAMVTVRPYNQGCTPKEALAELRRCAGTQFDPASVAAFCSYIEETIKATEKSSPVP